MKNLELLTALGMKIQDPQERAEFMAQLLIIIKFGKMYEAAVKDLTKQCRKHKITVKEWETLLN